MDHHAYKVTGTRNHWKIVGPDGSVLLGENEWQQKGAAEWLATELSRAYALGRLTGLQEAEERVKAIFR